MIKTALTAALVLGSVSLAMATGFDPNLANRYPGYNGPVATSSQALQTRNVTLTNGAAAVRSESYIDRASQSFGGGY
jgi:hypothetical protein